MNVLAMVFLMAEEDKTKEGQRVAKWLDKDILSAVCVDGDVFWLERNISGARVPNYVYDYIQKKLGKMTISDYFEKNENRY